MKNELRVGMTEQDLYGVFGIEPTNRPHADLPFGECPECGQHTLVYEAEYCTTCDEHINIEAVEQAQRQQYLMDKDN
ncbi:hypothetical protein [Neisseria yangbaofengii]|uniref:hypothetical protein n=1 Tax=Neisseria yangbaofengii TaxID=2709396 RepID=UPI0013EA04A5|nr:hypothetical protein [Neisseria yangbaofengii]